MVKKEPKTLRGIERKQMTGDGRKSTPIEKRSKAMRKKMEDWLSGSAKKRK